MGVSCQEPLMILKENTALLIGPLTCGLHPFIELICTSICHDPGTMPGTGYNRNVASTPSAHIQWAEADSNTCVTECRWITAMPCQNFETEGRGHLFGVGLGAMQQKSHGQVMR